MVYPMTKTERLENRIKFLESELIKTLEELEKSKKLETQYLRNCSDFCDRIIELKERLNKLQPKKHFQILTVSYPEPEPLDLVTAEDAIPW